MPGKRVRRRNGDGSDRSVRADVPDLEEVLDELYGAPPSDFVARREVWAAAARTSGRGDDARLIRGARRPTLAAWAANLLLRSRPEESRQFLELGESLREAYRTLDSDGLKALSDQRRRVVAALSREAAGLAREAGQRLSASVLQEVESTLRAVLADADAAERWAEGRLETALAPPSAFSSDAVPAAVAPAKGERPSPAKGKRPGPARAERPGPDEPPTTSTQGRTREDELAERRRERQLRLEREQRLAAAREAAETAERRLRDRRSGAEDTDASLRRTLDRRDRARRQVSAAERRLRKAREGLERAEEQAGRAEADLDRAEREQRQAERRRRAAADALTEAEREAHDTAQAVRRLTRSHGGQGPSAGSPRGRGDPAEGA